MDTFTCEKCTYEGYGDSACEGRTRYGEEYEDYICPECGNRVRVWIKEEIVW